MKKLIFIILLTASGILIYKKYYSAETHGFGNYQVQDITKPGDKRKTIKLSPPKYICDGRQYCSQMTSREEAVFFIKNCPNTKMDGDNDGIPCENDSRF